MTILISYFLQTLQLNVLYVYYSSLACLVLVHKVILIQHSL